MNLIRKIASAVISAGIGVLSVSSVCFSAFAAEIDTSSVYDSTLSEKSKDSYDDVPFNVFDIYNAHYDILSNSNEEILELPQNPIPPAVDNIRPVVPVKRYGIDVSRWQLDIDWNTVRNSGENEFAIIKAGGGTSQNTVDPYFYQNMKNAQSAGMDVGVYWYSTAMSVDDARNEAYKCIEAIKGYSFTYPVYYDFEHLDAINSFTTAKLSTFVSEFFSVLEENGYYVGIYASASILQNKLYSSVYSDHAVWVAEYGSGAVTKYDGQYGMWQYTGKGKAKGISTDVDRDICYVDYPAIIGVNPKNGTLPGSVQVPSGTKAKGYFLQDTEHLYNWSNFDKNSYQYAMLLVQPWQTFNKVAANIKAAHDNGIPCGIMYLAEDANELSVVENAQRFYDEIKGVKLEYPIYYWISKSDISGYVVNSSQHSKNIEAFCSFFENKKYYVGIAAYDNVCNTKISSDVLKKYSLWMLNEPGTGIDYRGSYYMASFYDSESGGYIHYAMKDFPDIMKHNGLNGF